ncbi:hypothetical protein QNI16_20590 [Cytophagaceae bacterium YF14B1]|uniref:Uncharacterized protein n=1 Tax=Xanthocytophaga flava TaxID=3048013 RepID=A0AAE3U8Q8_9BACT|nr:hypothetical protein [Xanthocytophaga flavus]MDJ1482912.1 hypothetical protein [Xanthocytophaga flavus]
MKIKPKYIFLKIWAWVNFSEIFLSELVYRFFCCSSTSLFIFACLNSKLVYSPEYISSYGLLLFPDPSTRKAKGQPRGKKIPYAPLLPSTIEVVFALFVTPFLLS